MNITKLVLPVAGLGKRLLPLTEQVPKNLIPVNNRPLIEYVLREAVESGIREVILVVNPASLSKFKRYLKAAKRKFPSLRFRIYIQETPGGNGHAIVKAYDLISDEPFAVRFCDDIIMAKPPILSSLIQLYKYYKAPIVLLEKVPKKLVSRFGVVGVKKATKSPHKNVSGDIFQITKIIEKPRAKDAPSNLTIVGGYVLTPHVVRYLKNIADTLPIIADDALPLAVALQIELIIGGKVFGWEFQGKRLDCGTLDKLKNAEILLKKIGHKLP